MHMYERGLGRSTESSAIPGSSKGRRCSNPEPAGARKSVNCGTWKGELLEQITQQGSGFGKMHSQPATQARRRLGG